MSGDAARDRLEGIGAEHGAEGPGSLVTHHDETLAAVDAARDLMATLRVVDAPVETLDEVRGLLAAATELLGPHRVEGMRMQNALRPERMPAGSRPDGVDLGGQVPDDPSEYFPYSPILGPLNPLSAPVSVRYDGERLRGTATFDARWVGPPGMVHGGVIALLFDELLGATNVCVGAPGFTGTLTIRYERPTPIDAELELECWHERAEGRKVVTAGTISHDGAVTARAEGIFIRAAL